VRGEVPGLVREGVQGAVNDGARCKQVEVVLEEIEAVRHAMSRANKGDLVVVCVDQHAAVMTELETWSHQAYAGAGASADAPAADPDYAPTEG
jgi:cyanophycin synthetase